MEPTSNTQRGSPTSPESGRISSSSKLNIGVLTSEPRQAFIPSPQYQQPSYPESSSISETTVSSISTPANYMAGEARALSIYQGISVPLESPLRLFFDQAKNNYADLESLVTILNMPDLRNSLQDSTKELKKKLLENYNLITDTMHNIELPYRGDEYFDMDFPSETMELFHALFENTVKASLLTTKATLIDEARSKANYRSYESEFRKFMIQINNMLKDLSPRLKSYLTDYTRNSKIQQLKNHKEVEALETYVNSHIKTENFTILDDEETNRAVRLVNHFNDNKGYNPSKLHRFQSLAERILLDSCRDGNYQIPKEMLTYPMKTLGNIKAIMKRSDQPLVNFSKLDTVNHDISKMLIDAFLNLRGTSSVNKKGANQNTVHSLQEYIKSTQKDKKTLKKGLIELKSTTHWQCNCNEGFKKQINSAIQNSDELDDLKKGIDEWISKENRGIKNLASQKEFELGDLISSVLGEHIAFGSPYQEVIETLSMVPSLCFEMVNHLFGTSQQLIQKNPEMHKDFRESDLFHLLKAMHVKKQLLSIKMQFDKNGVVEIVINKPKRKIETIKTAIMNPDGLPFTPSPINPIQIIMGPETSIPLAIEQGSKAITYDATTGYNKETYPSREALKKKHVHGLCAQKRKALEGSSIQKMLTADPGLNTTFNHLQLEQKRTQGMLEFSIEPTGTQSDRRGQEHNAGNQNPEGGLNFVDDYYS